MATIGAAQGTHKGPSEYALSRAWGAGAINGQLARISRLLMTGAELRMSAQRGALITPGMRRIESLAV